MHALRVRRQSWLSELLGMNISICISTFGSERWEALAYTQAWPSARGAHEVVVRHLHTGTLAQARNEAALDAEGDYLCFLDADDELGPDYIGAMTRAYEQERRDDGTPLLLAPAVSYIRKTKAQPPKFWPEIPLSQGNWLIIGTLVPRDLFLAAGGFREYGMYEDWDLFIRCVQAGAEIVKVPKAVYWAHLVPESRNRSPSKEEKHYWHQRIGHDNFPDLYSAPTESEDATRQLRPARLRFA
jgi:glycosyltransferase involved in cell wall biosynthesis